MRFNSTTKCFSAVACPELVMENAEILWGSDAYHFGSIVDIQCKLGFQMVGQSTLTCLEDGTWDNVAPTCDRNYTI